MGKFSEDVIQRLEHAIESGATYEDACTHAGISYNTFRNWILSKEKKEFLERINIAVQKGKPTLKKIRDSKEYKKRGNEKTRFIYLIRESFMNLVRIGVAKDMKARMAVHTSSCPQQLEVIRYFEVKNPFDLEYELHNKYKYQRYNGSWYSLAQSDIDEIVGFLSDFEQELYTTKSNKRTILNHKIDRDILENSIQLPLDF